MSLSEKIQAAEKALEESRDALVNVQKDYDENPEPAMLDAINDATDAVEHKASELESFRRAEKALAVNAVSVKEEAVAPAIVKSTKSDVLKDPVDFLVASAVATLEAKMKQVPFHVALEQRFGDNEGVKAVSRMTSKAYDPTYTDSPPLATTFTSGWAEELTRQGVGAFMDLLTPESIIPRLPLTRFDFGNNASIKIPSRAAEPDMAGAFIGEGEPIPVKAAALTSKEMRPKKCAVIGAYTDEILNRSTPSIVEVIRNAMLRDTAIALDTQFLSDAAESDIAPPGMASLVKSADVIDGSGMGTQAGAIAAIKAAITQLSNNLLGARPAWVMHPSVAWSLQMMQTAVGQPAFPELANGQLVGIPVYTSTTCPVDQIFLIDCAEIVFAGGAPRFLASQEATIHMADPALMISDNNGDAGAQVTAAPTRSLYQTDSHSLRTIWNVSWSNMRDGCVALITDVAV